MSTNVAFEKVVKAYSGKPGCCCGCNGDYHYTTLGVKTGTFARTPDVNDQTARKIVDKINSLLRSGKGEVDIDPTGDYVAVSLKTKIYIAYYKD